MSRRFICILVLSISAIVLVWQGFPVHGTQRTVTWNDDGELGWREIVGPNPIPTIETEYIKVEPAGTTMNYVAIGDSIAVGVGANLGNGYVTRFQQILATDNSAIVNLTNLGVNGFTSANLLNALQNDLIMRAALQNADVITFDIGSNDLLGARNSYKALTCGGVDNQDCLRTTTANFKTNWNNIVAEILALRANKSVNIRTIDLYNPFVNADRFADTFPGDGGMTDLQAFKPFLDEANNHIRTTTLSNGIALGRVYRSFNGVDGTIDPGLTYGLIAGDLFHPNNAGHAIIAERLRTGRSICLQPLNGLTAWYRGESNANDTTGNANHGTLENGTSFLTGKISQAFDFDGVDDSVLLPAINLGPAHTVEMWIRPAATQPDNFVHLASNDPTPSGVFGALGLFTNSPANPVSYSLKYQQFSTGDNFQTPSIILPNQWTHIAITHDSGNDNKTRLYVNGVLEAISDSGFTETYNDQLRLGHRINGLLTFYKGQMDEVSLYDRALPASELDTIVNADGEGKCFGTDLQISPTSPSTGIGSTVNFIANGGVSPFLFTVVNGPQHGTIDQFTGVYTANSSGIDTIRVTDSALFTSETTVTITAACIANQKTWDGGGSTNNWSEALNWTCDQVPAPNDTVIFNGTSTKNATINVGISVSTININAGYTGVITQANGANITTSNFTQTSGTFNGGAGDLDLNGGFSLSGTGIFRPPTGDMFIAGVFLYDDSPSAQFNPNPSPSGGTIIFDGDIFLRATPGIITITFNNVRIGVPNSFVFENNGSNADVLNVVGSLTLSNGTMFDGTIVANGAVTVDNTFGGGPSTNVVIAGPATRTVTLPVGAGIPRLTMSAPNAVLNASAGITFTQLLTLNAGTIETGSANCTFNQTYSQTGGAFTNVSSNLTFNGPFTQTGGTFDGGAGNLDLNSSFSLSGSGVFNAPAGNMFVADAFNLNSPTAQFNPNNGTVIFDGNSGFISVNTTSLGNAPFFNLTINLLNNTSVFSFDGNGGADFASVAGTLKLSNGQANGGTIFASDTVIYESSFDGGITQLNLIGSTPRTVTLPADVPMLGLTLNGPNTLVSTSGSGSLTFPALTLSQGTFNNLAVNITVSGNYSQSGGVFNVSAGTNFVCGNYTQTGGIFNGTDAALMDVTRVDLSGNSSTRFNAPSSSLFDSGAFSFVSTSGAVFDHSNGTVVFDGNDALISFNATSPGTITFFNLTCNLSGDSSTLGFDGNGGADNAAVLGDLSLLNGLAINSTMFVSRNITVGAGFDGGGLSLNLNGSANQSYTNNGGVNPTGIWTLNKPTGTVILNTDLDLSNSPSSFFLTSGTITTGAHLVDAGTRDVNGSSFGFIIGNLRRSFTGGGQNVAKFYHLGTSSGYSPVKVVVPVTPGNSTTLTPLNIGTVQGTHPLLDPAASLNYYWTMSQGAGLSATLEFTYPQAAVNGNEGNYGLDKIANSQVQIVNAQIVTSVNTATITGVTDFAADWTLSELPTPLLITPTDPIVSAGNQVTFAASGGHAPYTFTLVNNSGGTISPAATHAVYTAGSTVGVTDTIRVSDSGGQVAEAHAAVVDPFVVINTNSSGGGSLKQATINANNTPGTQTITFNIPGPEPHTISTSLAINDSIIIDGTTQPGYAGQPIIELNINSGLFGLSLFGNSDNSVIKGLVINRYRLTGISMSSSNNVIQGNYIGTDVSGNVVLEDGSPEEKTSISLGSSGFTSGSFVPSNDNLIGGVGPGERNILGSDQGIGISGGSHNNAIIGNFIGVGADGVTPLPSGDDGIFLIPARFNNIDGNVIANHRTGVVVASASVITSGGSIVPGELSFGNAIRRNSIFSNTNLGIDIRLNGTTPIGVTQNDSCDADIVNNGGQNFPELTFVNSTGGNTTIEGILNGEKNKTFDIDFYSNAVPDASGFGEGQTYLGSTQVTTPNVCNNGTQFAVTLPVALPAGHVVTATATSPEGNTSEFSHFLGIVPANISGTVLDPNDQPIPNILVRLGGSQDFNDNAVTDAAGRFSFVNLPLGFNFEVSIRANNMIFLPSQRNYPNLTTSQDDTYVGIVNSFTIGGKATQDGFSLSGVTVTLGGSGIATTTTDSGGNYAFNNLPSGTYSVTATKPDTTFVPPTINFPTPITSDQTADFDALSPLDALPGRIVFADTAGNIKAMNAGGSGLVTLRAAASGFTYSVPTLSRNGHKIVFNDTHVTFTQSTDPGGGGEGLITPDEIRTSNADGSSMSTSLNPGFGCQSPTFSPDEIKIACNTFQQIFTLDASGGNQTQITSGGFSRDPFWSPDGSQIVFARNPSVRLNIFKVNVTSLALTRLTSDNNILDDNPVWSPDGTRIAFLRSGANPVQHSIAVMNADGNSLPTIIATIPGTETFVDLKWSPDSARLAFIHVAAGGNKKLISILPDPNNNAPLEIRDNFEGFAFDWGPDNSIPTPAGTNTQVQSGRASITFPATSGANTETTITPIPPESAGTRPGGFVVNGFAYEISTTANFAPPVEVCIRLTNLIEPSMAQFNAYSIMHNEGGILVDRTSSRDFNNRTICGQVFSFSPIALAQQIDPALSSITGMVVNENGDPINDMPVALTGDSEEEARTDSNGIFKFTNLLQGGNYTVQPTKIGFLYNLPYQNFLNISGETTAVFTATQTNFAIGGTVRNGNGTPVADVTMEITGSAEAQAVTDANGNYSFDELPANGFYTVTPKLGPYSFTPGQSSITALQQAFDGIDFVLLTPTAAQVSVSGRVTDVNGRGLARSRVIIFDREGNTFTALTSSFGYYRIEGLIAGDSYVATVSHKLHEFAPLVISPVDNVQGFDFRAAASNSNSP